MQLTYLCLLFLYMPSNTKMQGLAITHIECMLKPPDSIGHISLGINVGRVISTKDVIPIKLVAPFQRVRNNKAREAHEILIMLPLKNEVRVYEKFYLFNGLLLETGLLTLANNIALLDYITNNWHIKDILVLEL